MYEGMVGFNDNKKRAWSSFYFCSINQGVGGTHGSYSEQCQGPFYVYMVYQQSRVLIQEMLQYI
jgi:hypothetical protein